MSTPENNSATPENQETQGSLKQQVESVIAKSTYDEDTDTVSLPDEVKETLNEDVLYAVTLEHRRRNTQASYTKNQQTLKSVNAEKEKLAELLSGQMQVQIPKEDQERLDDLKFEDPAAWREELNKLEAEAIKESRQKISELTGEAKKAAETSFELERRQTILNQFNESAEIAITDELIANDVPPRITKKLEEGKITFEEFLTEVETYVLKPKKVKNEDTLGQPNLGNVGGGVTPDEAHKEKDIASAYRNDMY